MDAETDRALLRRFEPVIRYTRGERFFPYSVEPYVRASSLWRVSPGRPAECLVPEGELTLDRLSEPHADGFNTVYFLKFIEPLNIKDLAVYRIKQGLKRRDPENEFHAGRGRLARVGYGSRFIDALFSITLLARGRVPGDTAAAAAMAYERMLREQRCYCYYGRVVRQNGWVALQYWFFYPFNNWRSGFFGVNDHEADWEMIYVYLSESADGELEPEWVAYASHDFSGDDLRRRWDDPELEKVGEHPVIYSGAGSHASYFSPGEYLTELELPFLSPLVRLADRAQRIWRNLLRYSQDEGENNEEKNSFNVFRIPFVDYARGDGVSIGPGGDIEWNEPELLDPPPPWAIKYRGLWGLYARDPIAGENAPAGPVYNRDGKVRRSWYDPLGWAGLDKVPPMHSAFEHIEQRCKEIEQRRNALSIAISEKSRTLTQLGMEAEAMRGRPHLATLFTEHQKKIASLSTEIKDMRARYAEDAALLEALDLHARQLQRGERGPARAHIRRAHRPASDVALRIGRIAEAWAALSIGVVILSFVSIALFARHYLILGLIAVLSIVVFIEASFRRRLIYLINNLTITLAIIASLILIYDFFWSIVVLVVLVAGGYIMWENIKELRG